jgi:hypothetical protein
MTPIEILPTILEDFLAYTPPLDRTKAEHLLASGPVKTGHVDGRIVFIAGIASPWPGVGEAWNLPGPFFKNYPAAPRAIRALLRGEASKYRRVQATVTDETSRRFDEWLGFQEEARLKDFGPEGQDGIIMRLQPWQ